VLRQGLEAFNREDLRTHVDLSDEDLEFVSALSGVDRESYRGRELWRAYFDRMHETCHEWRIADLRVFDAGDDRVAAVYRVVEKGKTSGVPVEHHIGLACRLRQGKFWRIRSYLDPGEALEAVGLRG
jgi:ketosteroid isomerase-like protein